MNNIGYNTLNNSQSERLLQNIIATYHLQSKITDRIEYCGSWSEKEPQANQNTAWFHLVEEGQCWMEMQGDEKIMLEEGDLVVFPYGSAHALCNVEGIQNAVLLCGEFEFNGYIVGLLLKSLPASIVVKKNEKNHTLKMIAQLLKHESNNNDFGSRSVINKLADALFVIALRQHINSAQNNNGLLAALLDPKLCNVLSMLHENPGKKWNIEQLAEITHQSKSSFVLHFNQTIGMPPIKYVHMLKMTEAFHLLKNPKNTVDFVSNEMGFENESSFRKCFKVFHGVAPGFFRKNILKK